MAEALDDAVVAVAKGGDAVAGVAPGGAAADMVGFDDDDGVPTSAEQRRQHRADEAATDDADIGFDVRVCGLAGPGGGILP